MTTIRHRGELGVDRHRAFTHVGDYRTIPGWFFAMRSFEPIGDQTEGVGATFATELVIGPKKLRSTVRITEWVPDEIIRLQSIDGLSTDSTWRFSDADTGTGTVMDVEFGYSLGGGIAGKALSAVVEPVVGQGVRHTDGMLRKQLDELAGS